MLRRYIGIDPGIANTGWAIVTGPHETDPHYEVEDHGVITTPASQDDGTRLATIYNTIYSLDILNYTTDAMCIERVFFGRNVSSAITTGKVIGVCELVAHQLNILSILIPPQVARKAIGGGNLDKDTTKLRVSNITQANIKNHHTADAVAVAIAGIFNIKDSLD